MNIVLKLALANAWHHRVRLLLTSLAMIAAACVVVWVVSGYDALVSQFHDSARKTMGRYDFFVMSGSSRALELSPELLAALKNDPAVAEVNPVMQARVMVLGPAGPGGGPGGSLARGPAEAPGSGPKGSTKSGQPGAGGPPPGGRMGMGGPALVGTNAAEPPTTLVEGRWLASGTAVTAEAVLSSGAAKRLQAAVGDAVTVRTREDEFSLKIVGIVEQAAIQAELGPQKMTAPSPRPRGPVASALYVSLNLAEEITNRPARFTLANIRLKKEVNPLKFSAGWSRRLTGFTPTANLISMKDLEEAMMTNRATSSAKMQAYSATGMSLLAALFIIFTTLSMGVNERIRQLAILRAVALTRGQVAAIILLESLVLALIGWGGGLAAGWSLLKIMNRTQPQLFVNGATLGGWCVALTGASALGGALAAAVLPAWRGTRVRPIEAFQPLVSSRPCRLSLAAVVTGVLLILVNPLLVFVLPMPDALRYSIYAFAGCTSMAVGFLLLTPLTILIAEKAFVPLVARVAGLDSRLLASQLTTNLWRSLGTAVSLTIGLGLFVATLTWGYSMLQPFVPGHWVGRVL